MKRLFSIIPYMRIYAAIFMALLCAQSAVYGSEPYLSAPRKAVRTSTDVICMAMPAATLTTLVAIGDWQGLKQGALTAVTALGTTCILKYSIHKRRPDGSDYHSFPSMHTATAFADAAFLQRRFGWKIGIPAYVLAAYAGWGRTFSRKHDWVDVCVGAAIGAGAAYIYTRPFSDRHNLSIAPYSTGTETGVACSLTF